MRIALSVVCLLAVVASPAPPAIPQAAQQSRSLYERLGGAYPIAVVVDAFIERLFVNETLNANPAIDKARQQVPKQGLKFHGFDPEMARATAGMAANQGLYNGFLAAGLVWGLIAADPTGFRAQVFFLACVIVAGVYGAATANRRILFAQALPGAIALAAVLVAR